MQAWKIPKQAAKPHSDFKSKHIDETFVNQTYDQNEPCCLQQGCTFTFNRSNLPSLIHTLPYPGEGGSSSLSFGSVPNQESQAHQGGTTHCASLFFYWKW